MIAFIWELFFLAGVSLVIAESSDSERTLIKEWIGVEKAIQKTREDWKAEKAAANRHIQLLEAERNLLIEKVEEIKAGRSQNETERERISGEIADTEAARAKLRTRIEELANRMEAIAPRLPPILRKKVKALLVNENDTSLGKRYQHLIGALNEVDKFNSELTVVPEIVEVEGTEIQVTVAYLGLGQAFYVNKAGTKAGLGMGSKSQWEWESKDDLGVEIARLIRIYRNEEAASFLNLPMEGNK